MQIFRRKFRNKIIRRSVAAMLAGLLSFGTVTEAVSFDSYAEEQAVAYSEFPASYRPYLVHLHKCYPNWEFVPDYLDVSWDDAVEAEAVSSKSLVQNVSSVAAEYKSYKAGDYDAETGTWTVYDGTNWIAASKEAVAFYMDPRNWLITTVGNKCRSIFQFMDYSYDSSFQTREGLETMIVNTFLDDPVIKGDTHESLTGATAPLMMMSAALTIQETATPSDAVDKSKENAEEDTEEDTEKDTEEDTAEIIEDLPAATPSEAPEKTIIEESETVESAEEAAETMAAETEEAVTEIKEDNLEVGESATEDSEESETEESETEESETEESETEESETEEPETEDSEAEESEAEEPETEESETETGALIAEQASELELLSPAENLVFAVCESLLAEAQEESYADIIMEAAEESGMNPYVIAAFILVEQGKGKSDLISGNQTDYPGYYNYFNIGAYKTDSMESDQRGLWWAKGQDNGETSYGRPWDTPKKAIIEGAKYLSKNYLEKGQNTIYYKKFNVNNEKDKNGNPLRTTTLYMHQFMTNIQGAQAEGRKVGVAYEENGLANSNFTFHIPVYKNMPDVAYEDPKPISDNLLDSLTVEGYPLSKAFDKNIQEYSIDIPSTENLLGISATAEQSAIILGAGSVAIDSDTEIVPVIAVSDSGARTYKIVINRNESAKKQEKESSYSSSSGSSSSGGGSSGGGSSSGGGGGGGAAGPTVKKTSSATFSKFWYADKSGVWRIRNNGKDVKSAWLCDDGVSENGQNVWYLMNTDGTMLAAGLVQDNTGNYYSLETSHNGYYGMLRYKDGTYDCGGVKIYMEFSRNHDGSFGAVKNKEAIEALKAKYGVTRFSVGNESCTYTSTFK